MINYRKLAGSTDVSVVIRIIDSTDGTPETGVVFNTSGIDLEYRREGAASTDITEATLSVLTDAHSDGGFLHIGNGYYRLDLPDAACASGAAGVLVHGTVTGMVVIGCYIDLEPVPADLRQWLGTAAATPSVAGVPEVDITHFGGTGGTFASGIPAASLTTSAINSVADQVWDEGTSNHLASGSFGAASQPTDAGTAQAGGANTITLRSGAVASDNYYNKQLLWIIAGTGAGQSEYISGYVGATRVATMAASWVTQPDATSIYVIHPGGTIPGASAPTATEVRDAVLNATMASFTAAGSLGEYLNAPVSRRGTAQAGTTSSITLDSGASATNNLYRYHGVEIIGGTGAGEASFVTGYTGASKVATVDPAFTVAPDATSVFLLRKYGIDAATPTQVATAVWAATRAGNATAGTFGEYVSSDVTRLSGDATAADNAEAFFDGTGYAGTNNVIPSVTTVTGNVNGNVGGSVASVSGAVGSVTGAVGSVTGDVGGNVTGSVGSVAGGVGGNVTGSVGSLAAQAKTDVNAEVVDALNVDTYVEPGQGTPAATTTIAAKVNFLYKLARNKVTQTTTTLSVFADDATTVDHKATVSDSAGTFTRGEIATGP